MDTLAEPPAGYVSLASGDARVVVLASCADAVRAAMSSAATLHAWASTRPERRAFRGRRTSYAVSLPGGAADVVVRHSAHGGLLAPLTRDLFLAPTRAPHELATSLTLRGSGARTPEMVAFAVYRAGPLLRRADVATRLVEGGRDLAAAIAAGGVDWIAPTNSLIVALARAGAHHPDLNLKNVLLDANGDAWVLDVDVVRLGVSPSESVARNTERLARSLEKWRRLHALPVTDEEIETLGRIEIRGDGVDGVSSFSQGAKVGRRAK